MPYVMHHPNKSRLFAVALEYIHEISRYSEITFPHWLCWNDSVYEKSVGIVEPCQQSLRARIPSFSKMS